MPWTIGHVLLRGPFAVALLAAPYASAVCLFVDVFCDRGKAKRYTQVVTEQRKREPNTMPYPPTGVYYMVYDIEEYYDQWNQYKRHFKMEIHKDGTLQVGAGYQAQLDAFDTIDTGLDGYISLTEWRAWMAIARVGPTSPSLSTTDYDNIFGGLDTGDPHAGGYGAYDGKLAFEELQYVFGVAIDF